MRENLDLQSVIYSYLKDKEELLNEIIDKKMKSINFEKLIEKLIESKINVICDNLVDRYIKSVENNIENQFENKIKKVIEKNYSSIEKDVCRKIKKLDLKGRVRDMMIKRVREEISNYDLQICKIKKIDYDY